MDSTSGGLGIVIFGTLIYFLPTLLAIGRERNGGAIVVNVFLGWTLIGWVVALAWAATLKKNAGEKPSISLGMVEAPPTTVPCPFCAEDIKPEAIVCKHCGRDLPAREPAQ